MRRRRRRWRGDRRLPVGQTARLPTLSDAAGDSSANPPTEHGASGPDTDWQRLEIEGQIGVPRGAQHFFRIEAVSGRSFAVWAPTEMVALAATDRIDRMTIATGHETFRAASVPVRRREGLVDVVEIAKVYEIKS